MRRVLRANAPLQRPGEAGSAGSNGWATLIEHHAETGVQWVVSFEGSNPPAEKAVWCANRAEAEKLVRLTNERPCLKPNA